jgi:hypothetical protein
MLRHLSVFLTCAISAFASPIYSVTTLQGPPGWTSISLNEINDAGQVAGEGTNGANNQAFIASPSGPIAVSLPAGWTFENGYGINNAGQIVGVGGSSLVGDKAFVATTSSITLIPIAGPWAVVFAYAINDSGQVTGEAGNFSTFLPYMGTTAGITAIPLPPGSTFGSGTAINNSGEVAGDGYSGTGVATNYQPFIGTPAGISLIPTISGWTMVSAEAINDSGLVAGEGTTSAGHSQAFVGTAAGVTAIPLPVGATDAFVIPGSLSDAGALVGNSTAGGWIWTASGGTQFLNTFVPSGWNIVDGLSIADSGLILALGSFDGGPQGYVELSPSPEPSAGLLAAVSILLLFCVKCRTGIKVVKQA